MRKSVYILLSMVVILWYSCRKPYNPKPITTTINYLVVEGAINTTDSTIIKLSRTVPLSSKAGSTPELGASVTILSSAGSNYSLFETGKGFYKSPILNLDPSAKYALKIMTIDGKVYQSDFVPVKNSPPIDSVYYKTANTSNPGLHIFADTHDPSNNTRYYRWDFNDTYLYHSAFYSGLYLSQIPQDTVLPRNPANQIYQCWRSDTSTNILINSSAKLAKDVISENEIYFIPSTSEQISDRYSILVKQYALTPDAYNYFQELKKNTEQLGSIFDAQPSELPGNIHCVTNPSEPVLGYMTAGSPSEKRVFIDNRVLPAWLAITPYTGCKLDTDLYAQPVGFSIQNYVQAFIYSSMETPISTIVSSPPALPKTLGYTASTPVCVDCTLRGTNQRPSFWIDE